MDLFLPAKSLVGPDVSFPFAYPAVQSLLDAGDLKRNAQARRAFLDRHVPADAAVCRVEQHHSRTVVDVSGGYEAEVAVSPVDDPAARELPGAAFPRERFVATADGMVSAAGGPWLAVTVADCLPLFLVDARTGAYALLHSGWQGTGILEDALALMSERFATRASDVHLLAGAGIHSCCYEVSHERAEAFSRWGAGAVVESPRDGASDRPHLDLYIANKHLAEKLGIATFTQVTHCTCCDTHFGSYRRQGREAYTSMLALMGPPNK